MRCDDHSGEPCPKDSCCVCGKEEAKVMSDYDAMIDMLFRHHIPFQEGEILTEQPGTVVQGGKVLASEFQPGFLYIRVPSKSIPGKFTDLFFNRDRSLRELA